MAASGSVCDPNGPFDDGGDSCRRCAIMNCCTVGRSPTCLATSDMCFHAYFEETIVSCFERVVASGSELDSWHVVAKCVDDSATHSGRSSSMPFPLDSDPGSDLVECIVGSTPEPASDASADSDDGDAGLRDSEDSLSPVGGFCARECFPG